MVLDPTEPVRRSMLNTINLLPGDRERLEKEYEQIWDTSELQEEFTVHSFLAPFVMVTRKSDNQKGMMMFQHDPRFYFAFQSDPEL